MNHGIKSVKFADTLIHNYSKLNHESNLYVLPIEEIPEHEFFELVSVIICENEYASYEATGPDNPEYERTMRPALIKLMKNSYCKETGKDFLDTWIEGITKYLAPTLHDLLDKRLEAFNCYR